jgi:hypothetical protein
MRADTERGHTAFGREGFEFVDKEDDSHDAS